MNSAEKAEKKEEIKTLSTAQGCLSEIVIGMVFWAIVIGGVFLIRYTVLR